MLILSDFLLCRETLEEFHDLHDRDNEETHADSDDILIKFHTGEIERRSDERHLAHERRQKQREPIVKILPRCERMFRLWKISAMDMVRNAIVVPSGLRPFAGISHTPDSMKWPMK